MPHEVQKPDLTAEQIDEFTQLPIEKQYAEFCSLDLARPWKYPQHFKALRDFQGLVQIKGVAEVGINWRELTLLIGTDCVETAGGGSELHELGEYILTFQPYSTSDRYTIMNMRPLTVMHDGCTESVYAHPHAMQHKQLCIDARNEINASITDRLFAAPTRLIMAGLWLDTGVVSIGMPYGAAALKNWPLSHKQGASA